MHDEEALMVPRMLLAVLALGMMTTPNLAETPPPRHLDGLTLFNTPLGKMVSGTVGRFLVLRSELNLTQEQRQQILKVLLSHRSEIAATVKSVREKRLALRDAVLAEKTDEAVIHSKADKLGKAIGEAAVKGARLRREVGAVLTTEQRDLVRKFIAENDTAVSKFLDKVIK
jgi:Spy/CpxP family protein refolding chaperone